MYNFFLIIVILLFVVFLINYKYNIFNIPYQENFNNQTGRFCSSCNNLNFNQCLNCFNCGFCIDKNGKGACVSGDIHGPYNSLKCVKWYSGDPFSYMKSRNDNYKCSYGPMSSNMNSKIMDDYYCNKKN